MSGEKDWKAYNTLGASGAPRPHLINTLDRFFPKVAGRALDLGAGSGRDTRELLRRGWVVDAVDNEETALKNLQELAREEVRLQVVASGFELLRPGHEVYDFISASYSLPFCPRGHFAAFFERVLDSLQPGGVFRGELFGERDSWANDSVRQNDLTFHSEAAAKALFASLIIEDWKEDERDGVTALGNQKHWHLFQWIVRKP